MFDFLASPLYIRLSPFKLMVRNVRTGDFISEVPEIAVSRGPQRKIVDVGSEAALHKSSNAVEVINPFIHPRSMVSDFTHGQRVLKAFMRKLNKRKRFRMRPRVVLHPQGEPAGGFTQIEIRAMTEMMRGAGASDVLIWQGPALTDEQVMSRRFPTSGHILE